MLSTGFRSWVWPDHPFLSPLMEADCCQCPDQNWVAWHWPSSSAAAACHFRCSAGGSWKFATFPHPCRSRCRGSWRSWAQPGAAASVLISRHCSSCSGGRPAAEPPGRVSSRSQRPLQEKNHTVWLFRLLFLTCTCFAARYTLHREVVLQEWFLPLWRKTVKCGFTKWKDNFVNTLLQ